MAGQGRLSEELVKHLEKLEKNLAKNAPRTTRDLTIIQHASNRGTKRRGANN